MGLVFRDSKQPQQQHKSPEPASTQHLVRKGAPSQTSSPVLMARMQTREQESLQGSLLFSGIAVTYFSSGFLVCSCYSDLGQPCISKPLRPCVKSLMNLQAHSLTLQANSAASSWLPFSPTFRKRAAHLGNVSQG